ncbi:uncharacterized protein B0H18DRAFT_532127 [Fomitopsis serialis]|uniref:uncharacterized protein n=1 Tax=Fomitopsis serialis TaxID=139415 RepID=UPI00200872F1|nr:uncharacterized protein B0H18DRAFT_532127 [Neoantrodia serialis]KAH9921872.1 hypothetical protein B0H18DRAFT_532127 [Neoantrodia serialis]
MTREVVAFRHLNTDVLLQVFEYLRPNGGLRPLSMTCGWVRTETKPVLFKSCSVIVKEPISAERFLPQSLWPYVCCLFLIDECPDRIAMRAWLPRSSTVPRFTSDPLLCGTMDPAFLRITLPAMPRLRLVHLSFHCREIHGIGWDTLAAILSTPLLRSFTLQSYLFNPRQPPVATSVHSLAPITAFRFVHHVFRRELRKYPSQEVALGLAIKELRHTLESLMLPNEVTPFAILSDNEWPRLRELHLNGELRPSPDSHRPFVSLFSGMPSLRVLKLELAIPESVNRQVLHLWPQDHEARFPWPDLDDLTVSFPSPDDQIYPHLPLSMRRLSLRCTPHHCFYLWEPHRLPYTQSPILCASEMLEILTKINAPHLDHLLLEYRADDAEDELWRCVARRFSQLTTLEIHRFQSLGGDNVTLNDIALRPAELPNLLTLRVHLELEATEAFQVTSVAPNHCANTYLATLQQTAAILASTLAHRNLKLWLLRQDLRGATWILFRLVQEQDIKGPRVEMDPEGGKGVQMRYI